MSPGKLMTVAVVSAFLIGFDAMVVVPLIPEIAQSTGTEARLGGLLVTMYALLFALGAPFFGAMSDRIGRRAVLVIGLAVFAVGNALTGAGTSFTFLLVVRAVSGLGAAMIMPSVYAMISDTYPFEKRGKAIGVVVAGLLSASVLGAPLGSYLAHLTDWRSTFYLIAGVSAVALVTALVLLPAMTSPHQEQRIKTGVLGAYLGLVKTAMKTPALRFLLVASLLWSAALYGMFSNIGVFYSETFGFNEAQTGLTIMGSGAGSMAGALLGGRIADRFGKGKVMVIAALVAAAGVISVPLIGDHVVPVIIAFVIWGTAVGVGQPCLTALVSELRPEARGTALALNSSAQYGGMMIATALAAVLLEQGVDWPVIGLICGSCALLVLPMLRGVSVLSARS
ncbi:MFS transporter [Crossiella sp. SN42]|uniref:MFS transporter n=1 Tax=Crossiella sp. SN42 TaxID=2944808 RepID=UPI00207D0B2A|nr:MFS transporter [Crossiella sp. SN42]MCO1574154.1 MFS transporter [Crossiella sp. SN42]